MRIDVGRFGYREHPGRESKQTEEEGDTLGQPDSNALLAAALDRDRNASYFHPTA
jgi:hypothetical protein